MTTPYLPPRHGKLNLVTVGVHRDSTVSSLTEAQERASKSRILCDCGHEEKDHIFPPPPGREDEDGRWCLWNGDVEEGHDDPHDGCACEDFSAREVTVPCKICGTTSRTIVFGPAGPEGMNEQLQLPDGWIWCPHPPLGFSWQQLPKVEGYRGSKPATLLCASCANKEIEEIVKLLFGT